MRKYFLIIIIVAFITVGILMIRDYYLKNGTPCRTEDLGKVTQLHVITRSALASDSLEVTLEDGTVYVITYNGDKVYHTGQHLVSYCGTAFSLKDAK